ncbi:MAG: 2-succinyl-5-enolpyruvyl-6-hydroxy-3-cyclohexene-1-carboxylic-acid synthase, partial [Actinobacteria bacterium]|nr:2-succinyl-5-enolpyruvyl-6-hydroxy-3-cyclohexene-1-carboxylic-acid synthase [Actinomycetota bacterium]
TMRQAPAAPPPGLVADLAERARRAERGVLVAGWGSHVAGATLDRLARALRWPLLADPLSGARTGPHAVSTYEALARAGYLRGKAPDLVLRFGAALTSKPVTAWLDDAVPQVVVDAGRAWLDPYRAAAELAEVDANATARALVAACAGTEPSTGASRWLAGWLDAERIARAAVDELLDTWEEPFEGRVARDVVEALPAESNLVVASSMPVRDVEAFARPRDGVRVLANRGVNGIDGFVSTVLGIAAGSPDRHTVALVGDLCFLHDANGLLDVTRRGIDATFVVLDNNGGGIFSFLPQAEHGAHFELLFGTPHSVDIPALAAVHGVPATRVEKARDVVRVVRESTRSGGVRVVHVPVDRGDNVARHRAVWDAVAAALDRRSGGPSS